MKIKGHFPSLIAALLLAAALAFVVSLHFRDNPEKLIKGSWKEKDWSYEKFDGYLPKKKDLVADKDLRSYVERDLIKHEFESWRFASDNLYIIEDGIVIKTAKWKLKGRGHILKITYDDGKSELYDIKELNDDEMVLHYDIGMEVRGIAKLSFTKS